MTEEIIIDGVNVAGCDFFAKEDLYNSYSGETQAYKGECGCSDDTMCKDIKNCCYKKQGKQLKRLEQENKELLEARNHFMGVNLKYFNALEEIREIAEPRFVNGLNEEADQYNQCMDRIQDKINEVLS